MKDAEHRNTHVVHVHDFVVADLGVLLVSGDDEFVTSLDRNLCKAVLFRFTSGIWQLTSWPSLMTPVRISGPF